MGREEASRRGLEQFSERKPWGEGSRSDRTGQDLDMQSVLGDMLSEAQRTVGLMMWRGSRHHDLVSGYLDQVN